MPSAKTKSTDFDDTAGSLRPYEFHGVMFRESGDHPKADCPFCGKEGLFSVTISKGTWGCFKCGEKGNLYTFLRRLWEESDKATNGASAAFAEERGLLDPLTLNVWGVVQSVLDGAWLVPGFNKDGKLTQLYKRIKVGDKDGKPRWELRPTPTLGHALHGMQLFDKSKPVVYLHESWGNALAFWEVLRQVKQTDEGLRLTASESSSLLAESNVLAVANCGAVGEGFKSFLPLFAGKRVVLMFDNDHPKAHPKTGNVIEGAGYLASKRMTALLNSNQFKPESIHWLKWGEAGHDPVLPSGFDVRDQLSFQSQTIGLRLVQLEALLKGIKPVPAEWLPGRTATASSQGSTTVEPLPCKDWKTLVNAWKRAFQWRQSLSDALAVMLAVCASTSQKGEQIFLQVIGDPGSGKTAFCEGMLLSKYCHSLEQISSFTSGMVDNTGEDFSVLSQMNHKTLITAEADVIISNPKYQQIMGQCRRIFDGSYEARWGNRKESIKYPDLRTPWIQAGTPAMLDVDQSRMGDRFVKIWIDQPTDDDRRQIIRKAIYTENTALLQTANGDGGGTVSPIMMEARRLTAGYVDWLRANAEQRLIEVHTEDDKIMDHVADLAEFTAYLRARPHHDQKKLEKHDVKELPARLGKQFVRMSNLLAVVLGRGIDVEVLRIAREVALGTSRGISLNLVKVMYESKNTVGEVVSNIASAVGDTEDKVRTMLKFLRSIGAANVSVRREGGQKRTRWHLSPRMKKLWEEVHADT